MSRLLILLTFVSWVAASNVATFTSTQVKHIELLTSFTISSGGSDLSSHKHHAMSTHAVTAARQHTQTTFNGLSVPHGDAVHLTFSAMGQHFSYPMRAYTELLGDEPTIQVWGANGWETHPMTLRTYIKNDGSSDWASMTIHPDGTFHALVHRSGEIYQVDPVDVHSDAMHTSSHWQALSTAAHAAHRMTVFKHSDLLDANMLCGSLKETAESTAHSVNAKSVSEPVVATHKRHLLQSFAGDVFQCQFPSGANLAATGTLTNGVVADYGLFVRYKTRAAVESYIQGIYASMNSVYVPQLATNLQLNQIVTYEQAGGDVFNVQPVRSGSRCDNGNGAVGGISITINQVLDGLTKWAQGTKKGQYSLWHQITDCFPPSGVVGLAWVGTLCSPNRAGVSGMSSTTWLTVAHEIGHNFGADHTFQLGQGSTGGIMDYGNGKLRNIFQFNRQYSEGQMCAEIGAARADPTGKKLNYGTPISPFCWQAGTTSTTPGTGTGNPTTPTTPPVVTPPVTKKYTWATSDWTACSADCGGTQSRRVACIVDDPTIAITIVDDSLCIASQKPGSSQSCGSACVYSWMSTLSAPADCLSPTNTKCAATGASTAGTQANPQKCVLTQNGQKITVADSMCPANTKPAAVLPCTLPVCTATATWSAPAFGPCSVQCGGGTQTRTVSCISGNTVVAATQCAGQAQPPASQPCNVAPCVPAGSRYTWEASAWTSCPVSCGGGLQTRTIQCKDNQANSYVALTLCSNLPPSQQSCNTQTCPVNAVWATSQPGPCSATCGTGTATITVRCVDPNDKTFTALPESRCDARYKPATSVACSLPPCTNGGGTTTPNSQYRWWIPSYSVRCSTTKQCTIAGIGAPICVNRMYQQVAATYCAGQSTAAATAAAPQVGAPCPGTTNPCVSTPTTRRLEVGTNSTDTTTTTDGPVVTTSEEPETNSTGPSWQATEWSECSAVCGGGSQSRNLTCVAPGGQTLPDSSCEGLRTVPLTQACNVLACTAFWYTGGWSGCSAPCDGGFMTRTTECRSTANPNGPAIDEQNCFAAPRPSQNQTCNAAPCPKWAAGSWSECSATCGDGWQSRNISCQTITGIEVDVSLCTSDQRPVYNRTCNDAPCPTFAYGEWSPCSKQCGGGIQNRTVTCRLPAHGTFPGEVLSNDTLCVANDAFAAQYGPPIRSRSCNEQSCPLYHYQVQSTSPCSATCGGGTREVTFICVDAQNKATAMSDCDGLDNKPESIQRCNTAPCPTIFGWRTGNFSACNVYCGKGVQKRDVFCINEATLETVDSRLCKAQRPTATQQCQQPESVCWGGATGNALKQGRCGNDGECICRPGYDGRNCSIAPATVQVNLPTNLYLAGVPQGENIVISWESSGAASRVSVLIQRTASEWTMQYLARNIPNTGKFEWSVGTHIKDLDYASNYTIRVWFKPGVYGDSPAFSIADPCQYVACGKHGRCNKGQCVCAGGWGGPTCAISPCEAAGCNKDHAVCNVRTQADGTSKTTCRCQDGWTGAKCYTPPSCTNTCKNGGDFLPAAVTDIPTPTTTTNESVATTGSAPGTCPIDVSTTPCLCAGGYTGKDCGTCGLQCKNGSRADDTCTSCVCPRGFFGASCGCRYYEIRLALSIDARSWIELLVSRTRFINTFANDLAAATGLSSNNIQVQKLEIGAYGRLYVDFWLTETCKTTSADAIGFTTQALIASSEGGDTIDTLYANVQAQFQDADSTLNYAPVLSSIVIGSVVASDPLGSSLPQPSAPQDTFGGPAGDGNQPGGPVPDGNGGASTESSSVNVMLIGIIVGCAVGAVILAGVAFIVIRNKRAASSTSTTLTKMNQVAMVPTYSGRTLSMNEGKKPQTQPGDEWTVNPACVSVQQRMQRV